MKEAASGKFDLVTAISSTSCSLIVTDLTQADNPIVFVNPAFTALTGYEPGDAIGRNCRFLQGADTNPKVVAEIRAAIASGHSIRREILNYREDGEPFWNDLMIDPVLDGAGTVVGFVGVQHKPTASQIAHDAQVEAESRLHNIVRNLPGYVFRRVIRPDGGTETAYFGSAVPGLLGIQEGAL